MANTIPPNTDYSSLQAWALLEANRRFNGMPPVYHRDMTADLRDDWIVYQQAMRRARPIIAQWSEWEQQTRNPAWR